MFFVWSYNQQNQLLRWFSTYVQKKISFLLHLTCSTVFASVFADYEGREFGLKWRSEITWEAASSKFESLST